MQKWLNVLLKIVGALVALFGCLMVLGGSLQASSSNQLGSIGSIFLGLLIFNFKDLKSLPRTISISAAAVVILFLCASSVHLFYNPQKHAQQGDVYFNAAQYREAIKEYSEAIKQEPQTFSVYAARALAYTHVGDYGKAIADYNSVINSYSNESDAYFREQKARYVLRRAQVYFLSKDFEKAWEDVHKVQLLEGEVDPEFIKDLRNSSGRES